jgi:ABC-type amino acid transport system permease subunit
MRHVVLPQAIKRMIPPFMNQSIIQLKNTSLVSTIAVADLLYQGTIITAATCRPLEVYAMVAVIYFIVLSRSGLSHCFHRLTAAFRQPANSVLDGKIVVKIAFGPFANRFRLR